MLYCYLPFFHRDRHYILTPPPPPPAYTIDDVRMVYLNAQQIIYQI